MKMHMRPRWSCEFCGKTGGAARNIANLDRICGMHTACNMEPPVLADLCRTIMALHPGALPPGYDDPMEDGGGPTSAPAMDWNAVQVELQRHAQAWGEIAKQLEEEADGCPACILAAYRAMKVHPLRSDRSGYFGPAFDFTEMKDAFWGEWGEVVHTDGYF